jgi:hypothetical protein
VMRFVAASRFLARRSAATSSCARASCSLAERRLSLAIWKGSIGARKGVWGGVRQGKGDATAVSVLLVVVNERY